MAHRTKLALTGIATSLLLGTLAGCGSVPSAPSGGSGQQVTKPGSTRSTDTSASATPTTPPVSLTSNVKDGSSKVPVDTLVAVKAAAGSLTKVSVSYKGVDTKGQAVKGTVAGTMAKDGSSWKASERLEPAATYTVTMVGRNAERQSTTATSTFATQALTLKQQTFPTVYPLKGSTVGVGMPVIVRFDVPVTDKKAFQKNLHLTVTPAQTGSWHWYSGTEVHFRPKTFWKPGTTVALNADLNGLAAGNGVYGQNSAATSFTIGRSLVTKVDLRTDLAKVYRNGSLIRTIGVSGGKDGWVTRSGTKLIMDKLAQTRMTNQMIGAKEAYDLNVKYAMRITNSGEFLHAAPWNTANFGRRNTSHGCVGMSTADAGWLFNQVMIGDPVVTTGTSRGIEPLNGYTDWNASFATYKKGSAL
ncbi:MAG: hypothetical protein JWP61_1475 [Friedmanniella sp.]|nr:hypothetical protein [Friedmanniella sp.]